MTTGRINQVATLTANLCPVGTRQRNTDSSPASWKEYFGYDSSSSKHHYGGVLTSFPRFPTDYPSGSNQRCQSIGFGSKPQALRRQNRNASKYRQAQSHCHGCNCTFSAIAHSAGRRALPPPDQPTCILYAHTSCRDTSSSTRAAQRTMPVAACSRSCFAGITV